MDLLFFDMIEVIWCNFD